MKDEAALALVLDLLERAINLDDILWVRGHTKWVARAAEWHDLGQKDGMVLRSGEISEIQSWASRRPESAPPIPQVLVDFINASVAREKRDRRRTRILQTTIGTLTLVAAIIVALGGFGVTRLMSGVGERTSRTAAELSRKAFESADYERAARLGLAGMNGYDTPAVGFDASLAETALTAAVLSNRRVAILAGRETAENRGRVESLALSPDGRFILTGSEDPIARLWDAQSGLLVREFEMYEPEQKGGSSDDLRMDTEMEAELKSIAAFSQDGARIVTARGKIVRIWDAETGGLLRTLTTQGGFPGGIESVTFSPNGAGILTGSYDGTARIWDSRTGSLIHTFEGHTDYVRSAVYSPDGTRVLTVSNDQTARIWDAVSGRALHILSGHHGRIFVGSFSIDGKRVVTGNDAGEVFVWNADTGARVTSLSGHSDFIHSAVFSGDGSHILTASVDGTARVWNSETGALEINLSAHTGAVNSAAYSRDSKLVVTASADKTARVWDAATGTLLDVLAGHADDVNAAIFSADLKHVVTASDDRTARVWNIAVGAPLQTLVGPKGWVDFVALSPDGRRVLGASNSNNSLSLWDSKTGALLHTFSEQTPVPAGGPATLSAPAFSPNGERILIISKNGVGQLWDADNTNLLYALEEQSETVNTAMFSPDGKQIATGCNDNTTRLWDAWTGRLLGRVANQGPVQYLAFSQDGRCLMIANDDGPVLVWNVQILDQPKKIAKLDTAGGFGIFLSDRFRMLIESSDGPRLWDLETSKPLREFVHAHDIYSTVNFVDVSSDGKLVLTASDDGTARVWDAESGSVLRILSGHTKRLTSAIFSPSSKEIITTSNDGTARLWDTTTGGILVVLRGHTLWGNGVSTVTSVALSKDGRRAVTGGIDGTVRVWNIPSDLLRGRDLMAKACSQTLANGPNSQNVINLSVLTSAEREAAPAIDPSADYRIEGDVSKPVSMWTRLAHSLGIGGR